MNTTERLAAALEELLELTADRDPGQGDPVTDDPRITAAAQALALHRAGSTDHVGGADKMVYVPAEFVRGFNTLAHNYSLKAEAPDFYHGVERDAFSNAYRRCGQDLAKLKAILDTAPLSPLLWLWTHCKAIGMAKKSDSGSMEHDIALFTVDLQQAARPVAPPRVDLSPPARLDHLLWEAIDFAAAHPVESRAVDPRTWEHLLVYRTDRQNVLTRASQDMLAERQRQIEKEGWTPDHDDEHGSGSMAFAAAAYAVHAHSGPGISGPLWNWTGWSRDWWKPKGQRHDLIRAGALILAELERLDRAGTKPQKG